MTPGLVQDNYIDGDRRTKATAHEVVLRQSLSDSEREEWDGFLSLSPSATVFHRSGWTRIVEKVLGHKSYYLFTRDSRGISGVLPVSFLRNPLFGDCLVSSPLAVYGGICTENESAFRSLLSAGEELARRLGADFFEMRNRSEPFLSNLPGRDLYVTFTQDLSPGPEALLRALPRDTRYLIRKSAKVGMEWIEGLPVEQFYEIYARSLHRLGTPAFPKCLFTALQHEYGANCRIFGVHKGKTVIAAVMCFYFKDQVSPYYAGALPEFYSDSPNVFMYWSLITQSCREGFRNFDFGRSKRGTGSFQFKSSWAMQISELPYRYHLVNAKAVPNLSPVDPKFRLSVSLWKHLPFGLTKTIGPMVVPWLPAA